MRESCFTHRERALAIWFRNNFWLSDSFAREVDMPQEIATRSLAALSVILALAGGAAVAGDAAFGGPTFSSTIGFDIAVSPDKKTFTAAFSGLEAILDVKTAAVAPIVTRVFSFSI